VVVALGVVAFVALGPAGENDGDSGLPADVEFTDLEPALVRAGDLGDRFEEDPSVVPADADAPEFDFDALDISEFCRDALESARERAVARDDLRRGFSSANGVTVVHFLALAGPGEPTLDQLASTVDRCGTFVYTGDNPTESRRAVEEVDGLGDEAIGVTTTVTDGGRTLSRIYEITVDRDGVRSSILVDRANPQGAGPADRDLARGLAAATDNRLRQLLDG
jgi:hypothetical protein